MVWLLVHWWFDFGLIVCFGVVDDCRLLSCRWVGNYLLLVLLFVVYDFCLFDLLFTCLLIMILFLVCLWIAWLWLWCLLDCFALLILVWDCLGWLVLFGRFVFDCWLDWFRRVWWCWCRLLIGFGFWFNFLVAWLCMLFGVFVCDFVGFELRALWWFVFVGCCSVDYSVWFGLFWIWIWFYLVVGFDL